MMRTGTLSMNVTHHTLRGVFVLPALIAMFVAGSARAATIKVGKNGIVTIQQAVDAALANADANDTITVPGGIYNEMVSVTLTQTIQTRLTIERTGSAAVTVFGTPGNPAIRVQDSANVTLKDLSLRSGTSGDGVAALELKGTALNVHAENLKGTVGDDVGVMLIGSAVSGATLKNCDFSGQLGYGFWIDGRSNTLDGCTADSCGLNSVVLTPTSANCAVKSCSFDGAGFTNPVLPGVVAVQGIGHRLEKTTVSNGGSAGFFINGALGGGFVFDRCTATQNLIGVRGGGQGVVILKGTYKKNTSHGMYLDVSGVTVKGATIQQNGGQGIDVVAGVDTTTIVDNKFKSNGGQGALIEGNFAWLEGNSATGDGFDNVEATGNSNSGRDNTTEAGQVNDFK